ncbi:MAG: phosphoglycerate dehydrogenase [Chloroflexota bacterium]|jgi:D-3-phosphoglycerate dehydrogenase
MAKGRVLITSAVVPQDGEIAQRLREAGFEPVFNYHGRRTTEEMIRVLDGIDGVIAGTDPFDAEVLANAKRLKVIGRIGVGYDAIDVKAATANGIAVCITPGTNQHAVADFTMGLILQCSRKIMENISVLRSGGWQRFIGHDLNGKTLGIVGLGSIGKEVAKRAKGFGMRILAYDVYQDEAFAREYQINFVPVDQLIRESDYVTLHCFLNEETRHLINATRLAMMKPTAYLINTARGGIVDTEALYQALKEKRIAGAALDVFEQEPLPVDHPLRQLDNAYLASHVAGISDDSIRGMSEMAAENVMRVLQGKQPLQIVNPEVLK